MCTGLGLPVYTIRYVFPGYLLTYAVQNVLKVTSAAQQTACCCECDEHRALAALLERRYQAGSYDMAPTPPLLGAEPKTIL